MSSSSSLCSSSFTFQSSEFSSSSISNRLDSWCDMITELVYEMISQLEEMKRPTIALWLDFLGANPNDWYILQFRLSECLHLKAFPLLMINSI